jgi:hypothetical protein
VAWRARRRASDPLRSRAFFRGFLVGSQDPRGGDAINPYAPGGSANTWQRGHDAGVAHQRCSRPTGS